MTDISYPTSESLTLSQTTSPRDQYSNTANYSPRQPTGSVFQSTPSFPQGSIVTESPRYSIADSPRDNIVHQHVSANVSPQQNKPISVAEHITNYRQSPVQASSKVSRESNREDTLRLEELRRKEAEEKLRLQKEQEEKAKVDRIAEEKRLEEEKRKQLLLARLKEIDNSQSTSPQPADTKPHTDTLQPAKKKRLEDILNDGTAQDKDDVVDAPVTKPAATINTSEDKRKKELLAQLLSTEEAQDDDGLTAAVESSSSIKSAGSTGSNYKWNTRIENMHQGKPAMASKDDPFGKRASRKGSLTVLDDASTSSKSSIPQRKKSDGGLDFLGGTGGAMNTNVHHSRNKDTPTFGRRANQKPHPVFGSDIDILSTNETSKTETTTAAMSSKTYPWEREINLVNDHNTTGFNSNNNNNFTDSLLPRRAKAQPLNIGSMPGQIDDDIEELSLV